MDPVVAGLLAHDPTLFVGDTAAHALGWLGHPDRYLGQYLDQVDQLLPRRHGNTLLLGMGGSSSPARLYAEAIGTNNLTVLDTSNPDSIATIDFASANVIASSKSGSTIETQTLLAHALAHGLEPRDLVIITDPGTTLEELGYSLGALVFVGDPDTGGRFSGISPFGLIPALYAGWTPEELRSELVPSRLSAEVAERAVHVAGQLAQDVKDGQAHFPLDADPITSGGGLWLEQLVAETTGKLGRGFVPVLVGAEGRYRPAEMMHWQLVAALLARHLEVDPFNQPNVESAKRDVFALLRDPVIWPDDEVDVPLLLEALSGSTYTALQVYAPLSASGALSTLRAEVENAFGTTTANLGPRYLHSTGQLHKGGPAGVVGLQIIQRPVSTPQRIEGRAYTFHDLHMAQAQSDLRAMKDAGRTVWRLMVDDLADASRLLSLGS